MDIVKKIQNMPDKGQMLEKPLIIYSIKKLN